MTHEPDARHIPLSRRAIITGGLAAGETPALTPTPPSPARGHRPHKPGPGVSGPDRKVLMRWARDTWRSLVAMTDPRTGLVSDNITGDLSTPGVYTSPTNMGGYLWSTIVARDLRIITPGEASRRIRQTLRTLQGMEHHEASGMYFNWYDPRDGSVIYNWPEGDNDPVVPFVSSVDAAWLGAALLVVRNADPSNRKVAGQMFDRMRFDVFADPTFYKPYLMYGGFYLEEPTALNNPPRTEARDLIDAGEDVWYTADHHYDTIVSETRVTTYLALAKQQVPASAYFQAWRTFPPVDYDWQEMPPEGEWRTYFGVDVFEGAYDYYDRLTVPGWGGSMFEELMPNVFVPEEDWAPRSWGRNHPNHVAVQRLHGMEEYGYWGFSPASHPAGGYAEWGVDALGLNPDGYFSDVEHTNYHWDQPKPDYGQGVVTPHAAFLAMMHERAESIGNLQAIESDFDSYGAGGFYDAINTDTGQVAVRYLSLDQAMIMGALGNVLADNVLQKAFVKGEVERYVRPVIAPEEFGASE
ncbi:DUF3131 domain-containing protein [Ornithinimicrobium sp. LYQ103]|uniref:DUF3131 domain-containing protein n=1 Tax=Ornithinimicrobium sp. LYQ103 TaxID=3378796 RepID=UPI0038533B33